jgi:outer membrane protein TolC
MNRPSRCSLPRRLELRWLAATVGAANLALAAMGCAQPLGTLMDNPPVPGLRAVMAPPASADAVVPASYRVARAANSADEAPERETRRVPISLDTVLRLAEEQNRQIALARERVNEASAEKNLAANAWIPDIFIGTSYYRHDGGIQLEDGQLIRSDFGALFNGLELRGKFDVREATFLKVAAERKFWQQRGELRRITNETLLDAANSYIDMLQARSSVAVAREMEKRQHDLLDRAQKILKAEPGTQVQVEGLMAEIRGHRQLMVKVEQQGDAAAVKLSYLLGLDPCAELVSVDGRLVPFDLVDASLSTCQLTQLALEQGPGVAELERLLALIQSAMERSRSPMMMLPIFEMRMAEGGFGAGPGGGMGWDNRWDMNLQARWNLNGLIGSRDRQRAAQSKLEQVQLTYLDLRAKLTAGVQEARDAIVHGRQQLSLGEEQIRHAQKAYELSHSRLTQGVPGSSINEVQQTVRLLELAQLAQLNAIASYDKAQLRLMLLLGPAYCGQAAASGTPAAEQRLPVPEEKRD